MPKLKAFLETTIFNRYFEAQRDHSLDIQHLFEKSRSGRIELYTSAYVIDELIEAPEPKREQMLQLIGGYKVQTLQKSPLILDLADVYVEAGIIPPRFRLDGVHIATASVYNMDCILSLNFRHINKMKTKNVIEAINKLQGYNAPLICAPGEVLYDDEQ
jgi:predicted nucleic acid-binding protein